MTTTPHRVPGVTITLADELVAGIPQMIGYYPQELMIAAITHRDPGSPTRVMDLIVPVGITQVINTPKQVIQAIQAHLTGLEDPRVFLVAYSTVASQATRAADLLADQLPVTDFRVVDADLGGPDDGTPALVPSLTAAGFPVPARSRDAVWARVMGPTEPEAIGRGVVAVGLAAPPVVRQSPREQDSRVQLYLTQKRPPMNAPRAAMLAGLLSDEATRNRFYGTVTMDTAPQYSDALLQAIHLLPNNPRITGLVEAAGITTWLSSGDGTLLNAIAHRVERLDPDSEFPDVLRKAALVDMTTRSTTWDRIRATTPSMTPSPGVLTRVPDLEPATPSLTTPVPLVPHGPLIG